MPPKSRKLLQRMRQSAKNAKLNDIISLYEGYGFTITHGSNHDLVRHPDYPQLKQTLPRHGNVKTYLVRNAIKLVEQLLELQAAEEENETQELADEPSDEEIDDE
jgi:hypothetical protein